ncbi:MAG: hypothetical protein LAN71_17660 [Acidobacteriia bacterium]|nr:hypothetical protein [Terriglobia bacterium]
MRTTFSIGVIVILMLSLCFVCCSTGNQGDKIVGKWHFKEAIFNGKTNLMETKNQKGATLEFFPDKTYFLKLIGGQNNGNWLALEDGRIKMTSKYGIVEFGLLNNNKLIVKKSDGDWVFYR